MIIYGGNTVYQLGNRSKQRLKGVHSDLIKVVEFAIKLTPVDFTVLEGLRTQERQLKLCQSGSSQTMNSRHLTGHAVDLGALVDNRIDWSWPLYDKIAKSMLDAAENLNVPIEWGGHWKTLKDGPHFQLPWKDYPIVKESA